jgi:hypothetical protein
MKECTQTQLTHLLLPGHLAQRSVAIKQRDLQKPLMEPTGIEPVRLVPCLFPRLEAETDR